MGNSSNKILIGDDIYDIHRLLGKGAFGKVYVLINKKEEKLAMKLLSKEQIANKGASTIKSMLNERRFLAKLTHPNIVNLICALQDKDDLMMISDFMAGGDLQYALNAHKTLSDDLVKFYAAGVILALEYIHSEGYIHRDIKPDNIMLDEMGYARLTDFNVATQLKDGKATGFAGSLPYIAPEIYNGDSYGSEVDLWSLGVVIFELLAGRVPWVKKLSKETKEWMEGEGKDLDPSVIHQRHPTKEKLATRIRRATVTPPSSFSSNAKDLVSKMCTKREERIKLGDLKKHPYFEGIDWEAMLLKTLAAPVLPEKKANVNSSLAFEDALIEKKGGSLKRPFTKNELDLFAEWDWCPASLNGHLAKGNANQLKRITRNIVTSSQQQEEKAQVAKNANPLRKSLPTSL